MQLEGACKTRAGRRPEVFKGLREGSEVEPPTAESCTRAPRSGSSVGGAGVGGRMGGRGAGAPPNRTPWWRASKAEGFTQKLRLREDQVLGGVSLRRSSLLQQIAICPLLRLPAWGHRWATGSLSSVSRALGAGHCQHPLRFSITRELGNPWNSGV